MDMRESALRAHKNAYAPYSNFKVGAAILAPSGEVYIGCNVENAAYPEGTCAEAGAIAAMIAAGESTIARAYVIADANRPVSPCGGCRQKLAEFAQADVPITMATLSGVEETLSMQELLPGAFDAAFL